MKYVCLGFFDEAAFAQIPQADAQRMMEECFAYDDVLRRGGHFLGGEALDSARNAVTLRMKDGEVQVTDGPYRGDQGNARRHSAAGSPRPEPRHRADVETPGGEDGERHSRSGRLMKR